MKLFSNMRTPPGEFLQTLLACLTGRGLLPKCLDEPPHPDATPELERRLESALEQRLGHRHRQTGT